MAPISSTALPLFLKFIFLQTDPFIVNLMFLRMNFLQFLTMLLNILQELRHNFRIVGFRWNVFADQLFEIPFHVQSVAVWLVFQVFTMSGHHFLWDVPTDLGFAGGFDNFGLLVDLEVMTCLYFDGSTDQWLTFRLGHAAHWSWFLSLFDLDMSLRAFPYHEFGKASSNIFKFTTYLKPQDWTLKHK